jgi:hypothetical protein
LALETPFSVEHPETRHILCRMPRPTRIAVRVDSAANTAWAAAVLRRIEQAGLRAEAVVEAESLRRSSLAERLFGLVCRLDKQLLGLAPDPDSVVPLDAALLRTADDDAASIDLVIDLSTSGGAVPEGAQVWRVLVDGLPAACLEPYFWCVYSSRRVCTVTIERTWPSAEAAVIASAVSAVDPVSMARTRGPILWKTAEMVGRALERESSDGQPPQDLPELAAVAAGPPDPVRLAAMCIRTVSRVARRRVRKTFGHDEWFVATRHASEPPLQASEVVAALLEAPAPRPLPNPPRVSRADPFVFDRDGSTYLFFEDVRGASPGRIVVAEVGDAGFRSKPMPCLVLEHHVSYPFVFEDDGVTYLLPESSAGRTVDLYRATRFPFEWELERTLLDEISAVDPTLVRHDGRWWLFVGVFTRGASPSEELALFHAQSLADEWTPHPENPIVADVRCARPAGPVFRVGDDLVRPAQDSSHGYGSSISLRRIVALTPERYREEPLGSIGAGWLDGAHATHTYGRSRLLEVTDGQRYVLRRPWRR